MGSFEPFSDLSKVVMIALMWIGRLEIVPGANGIFDVHVDGTLVFTKSMIGRYPDPDDVAPLLRTALGTATLEDVGNAAAFLCSDLANGITGEILYVDGGFSTVGMSFPQEAGGE